MPDTAVSLRKAAILVSALDTRSADALLEGMPEELARQVRDAILDLGDISSAEQAEVIAEFFGRQRAGATQAEAPEEGVELALSPAAASVHTAPAAVPPAAPSFRLLREAELEDLLPFLQEERAQTVAVVLAHLPPHRALGVAAALPERLRNDALRRLAGLADTDPETVRAIEQALEARLARRVTMGGMRETGLRALERMFATADARTAHTVLGALAGEDPRLAARLGHEPRVLRDLEELSPRQQARVLRAAAPQIVELALAAWSPERMERVLPHLPSHFAAVLRQSLAHLGPVRLSDVEQAQEALVETAQELLDQGEFDEGSRTPAAEWRLSFGGAA